MEIENPNPDSQAPQGEGVGKVDSSVSPSTDSLDLATLSKTLGSEFKSKDEALKSLENLKSFVGDQKIAEYRQASEEWSSVKPLLEAEALSNGFSSVQEYLDWYRETSNQPKGKEGKAIQEWREQREKSQSKEKESKEMAELREKVDKMEYREKLGDKALKYYEDVKVIAQARGVSTIEAFNKSPFKELVEADGTKNATSIVENTRVSPSQSQDYVKDLESSAKSGDWTNFMAKHKGLEIPK